MSRAVYAARIYRHSSSFPPSGYLSLITKSSQTESCKRHSHTNAHPNSRPLFLGCSFISPLCIPLSLSCVFHIGLCRPTQNSLCPTILYMSLFLSLLLVPLLSPIFYLALSYTFNLIKSAPDRGIQGTYVNPVKTFHVFIGNICCYFEVLTQIHISLTK